MKQLNLLSQKVQLEFGGTLNKGKRKIARPLHTKRPLHFVFKATSPWLLLRNVPKVGSLANKFSKRFGVQVYSLGPHADHIHLSVRITCRVLYRRWIRSLTSALVRAIPGLKFMFLPYSRILTWGREFKSVNQYIQHNLSEGEFMSEAWIQMETCEAEAWPRAG